MIQRYSRSIAYLNVYFILLVYQNTWPDGILLQNRLGEKIHKAKTVSRVDESKGEWEALLLDDVTGDELLAVTRNLTCSEKGAFKYNQTLNTTWNCLISRRIFGVENKSPSFLEVNGVNVSPIFSD